MSFAITKIIPNIKINNAKLQNKISKPKAIHKTCKGYKELKTFRKILAAAGIKMIEAIEKGDYIAIAKYKEIIDEIEKHILMINEQKNFRLVNKIEAYIKIMNSIASMAHDVMQAKKERVSNFFGRKINVKKSGFSLTI